MNLESTLFVMAAIGLGAFCKGATGTGLPLIAIPLMASFVGVPHAVTVMAVPIIVSNAWQVWSYWDRRGDTPFLPIFLITGMIGIATGTAILSVAPPSGIELVLGVTLFAYIALRLLRPDVGLGEATGRRISPAAGLLSGLSQGSVGLAAPILLTFLHSLRLEKDTFVFAASSVFLALAAVQLPSLALAGFVTGHRLLEGLLALVPVAIMMPAGAWVSRFFSQRVFDNILLGLLTVIAIQLILRAF